MKIKVSDYIAKRLVGYGVSHIFMVTGGGAMHLNKSFGGAKGIKCIFCHHEQACAIAAEGYSRVRRKLAVVNVTSGPGGLNALTGVMGQWTDSVPVLYISGQVKQETTIGSCPNIGLRQLGDQEVDIISIVKPIVKFAVTIKRPKDVKKILDKAVHFALSGRPGPVWVDIPLDVQGALVDEKEMASYDRVRDVLKFNEKVLNYKIKQAVALLRKSKRPVLIAGHGIRISGGQKALLKLIKKVKIPVLATFNGIDLVSSGNPYLIGKIGTLGSRAGNFALQNADFVLGVGTRNNIRQVSYNWNVFARNAKKIFVDIDPAELKKPTIQVDLPINCDAKYFLEQFFKEAESIPGWTRWLEWCKERKKKYPVVLPSYNKSLKVNPYYFIDLFTKLTKPQSIIVAGNASACVLLFQAGIIKNSQRVFWNSGCASMGYDLPAAVGACLANNEKGVICVTGDGSMQMNLQELQTISHYKLPIKVFVLNNQGYISIKQTQKNFFGLPYIGCDMSSGVSFPDFIKIAKAYSFSYSRISSHKNLADKIKKTLNTKGPVLCEVLLEDDYKFSPRLSSERLKDGRIISKPLEDLYPFLDRREFMDNMLVDKEGRVL